MSIDTLKRRRLLELAGVPLREAKTKPTLKAHLAVVVNGKSYTDIRGAIEAYAEDYADSFGLYNDSEWQEKFLEGRQFADNEIKRQAQDIDSLLDYELPNTKLYTR